jgi:hypothetical protein
MRHSLGFTVARRSMGALLLLHASLSAAHAQTIRGKLGSGDPNRAAGGAIVVARDSSNADVARTLSGADGSFSIRLRAPGLYHLSALRVGFKPVEFGPYRVGATDDVQLVLQLVDAPIALAAIHVASNSCRARDKGGDALLVVWEEAREALLATVLARTDFRPVVTVASYERVFDPRTARPLSQTVNSQRGVSTRPFASILPADEYAAKGYAENDGGGVTFRAPDADVLLSDSFAASHCFRLTSPRDPTQMGLAFEPTRTENGRIDVGGTLLLDRRTGELRSLDFHYVGLSEEVTTAGASGHLDFVRLPGGAWVVASWELTAPRAIPVRSFNPDVGGSATRPQLNADRHFVMRDSIADVWRIGGALVRVTVADTAVWHGARARLRGSVLDDGDGAAIPRASVALKGTNYTASADARGEFAMDDVLPGSYDLEIRSPMIAATGANAACVVPVVLGDTVEVGVTVRVPSVRTGASRVCHVGEKGGSSAPR